MKPTDRRLWQSTSFEDFVFRLRYNENDNALRRIAIREVAGLLEQGFVTPDASKVWGGDFSDWDGNVNFEVFRQHGASFAVIKAMDGTVPSKYFAMNNYRAAKAGLLNGAYAWLYPDKKVSCKAQALAYHNLIVHIGLKLPPVIDFEWTRYAGQQANPNYDDLDKWATEFIRVSGKKPILYSAAGYMNMFGKMPDELKNKFSGIWLASYGGTKPIYPMGINSWDMWQFTSFGDALTLAPGDTNKKELDLNYMTEAFYSRYGGSQPQEGETMAYRYEAISIYRMSLRSAHDTNNTPITSIPAQAKMQGNTIWEAEGEKWLQVESVNGVVLPVFGWVAIVHEGRTYCALTDNNPPASDVYPVENTLKMSDGSVWKSTEWAKQ